MVGRQTPVAEPGSNLEVMRVHAPAVSGLLKTLSHPVRLLLACTLAEGEHSVGMLEERLGVRQPTLSQQLTVLREAAIVDTRRSGKQIFYRLAGYETPLLIAALYTIYGTADEPD
ncbi:metalloregulator ArsR/SmtB family transcription factor [Rhizobium sp. SAFR-030]|uniref:metalloregulator ArsR/SmtB family transcription factor n=1 Tax=Rhizobium sp. SAFR-030 TaxID=3387277 RepID=UPI003F80AEC8